MLSPPGPRQSQPDFNQTRIIHAALLTGPLLFLAVTLFLKMETMHGSFHTTDKLFWMIGIFMGLSSIPLGIFIQKIITSSQAAPNAQTRLTGYMVRWALGEGAMLFNLVFFFLSSSLWFLPMVAVLGAAHILAAPRREDFETSSPR